MTTDNDRDIFLKAIDVLEERGWTQGTMEDGEGRVCLVGALRVALSGRPRTNKSVGPRVTELTRTAFGLQTGGSWVSALIWNDAPERSYEEVVLCLKRAANGESAA
jgi:hypothetical protein